MAWNSGGVNNVDPLGLFRKRLAGADRPVERFAGCCRPIRVRRWIVRTARMRRSQPVLPFVTWLTKPGLDFG
jgi:hypothetical protein